MEEQVVSMVMRGCELTMRITKEGMRMGMKLIALIKAAIDKQQHTGQVPKKWLTSQYNTTAFTIPREQIADFKSEAAEINMMYSMTGSRDPDLVTVIIRQSDIQNFNHIMNEIGVVENDVQETTVDPDAKDEGIITEEHEGKGFYEFTLSREDGTAFQTIADKQNIIYATPQDVGAPTDYLKKDEMLKESYHALVERNKDNSDESGWVHKKHWPHLQKHDEIEVMNISEEQYEQFKAELGARNKMGGLPFAVAAKDGNMQLAYATEDRAEVQEITGESKFKRMVGRSELDTRMKEQAQKGDHSFVIIEDQREQASDLMRDAGIEVPEMKRISHGGKYFEDLDHRIERMQKEAAFTQEKEKETAAVDKVVQKPETDQEYCLFGLYPQEADGFRAGAAAQGLVYVENRSEGFSQFLVAQEQKEMAVGVMKQAGVDLNSLHMENTGTESIYINRHWKTQYGAEMAKLDRKRKEIISEIKKNEVIADIAGKVKTVGGGELSR